MIISLPTIAVTIMSLHTISAFTITGAVVAFAHNNCHLHHFVAGYKTSFVLVVNLAKSCSLLHNYFTVNYYYCLVCWTSFF